MFAVALVLLAAMPAGARAAGEESAGGGSTPGEAVVESPGGSTEPPSTGWTGEGGSTGASSGGGAATPGTSLGSGGGQTPAGSTGGEHSGNTGSSGHSAPEPTYSAPEPTYSEPEPSSPPSSEEHASTPAPSGYNGPATAGKGSEPPATDTRPVRIGIGAARAVAVSQTPQAPISSLTPESAAPIASSRDRVASGSGGLPVGVVILLALIIVCMGGLGVRHWDRRRKQAAGQESRSTTPRGRAYPQAARPIYDGASGGQTARGRRHGVRRLLPSRMPTQAARPIYDGASGGQTARGRRHGVRRLLPLRTHAYAEDPMRESLSEMFASPERRAAIASERAKLRRSNLPWRRLARLWDRDSQRQF
jgi:hypothetical protein